MANRWKTLEHNGIMFPPAYKPKGIRVRIRGEDVEMDPDQEEMAYQWAKKKDTPYAQDEVFRRNFTLDFVRALNDPKFKYVSYRDIDFSEAYKIVDGEKRKKEEEKEAKRKASEEAKKKTKEERQKIAAERKKVAEDKKEERERERARYGMAVIDGSPVEIANYRAEPPGIFIGRGEHPIRGRWKPRVTEGDVTLNLGKEARVPEGRWKRIIHDRDSMWLASWTDALTQKRKYVWLADTAGLKQDMDRAKYEKAVMLADRIGVIRSRITRDMGSGDPKVGKVATVCYLIYRTAMRVGDEKDPDEADTVGATTLRREHVSITDDSIEFDFLGKDSVRWRETVRVRDEHDRQFQTNLSRIAQEKRPHEEIFDGITSRHVNAYYSGIVKGLTAKVFRTYLATTVVREYLEAHDDIGDRSANEKTYHAKMANLEAAIMCNHKRTIPKTFEESLRKKEDTLEEVRRAEVAAKPREALKKAQRAGVAAKPREALKKAQRVKPKTDIQKRRKTERLKRIKEQIRKQTQKHEERLKRIKEQIRKQTQKHEERVERLSLQVDLAKRTRDYNLGTSLRNYIDPRVFMAWSNEVGAEWEKMYTAALQKKFLWVRDERVRWSEIKGQWGPGAPEAPEAAAAPKQGVTAS